MKDRSTPAARAAAPKVSLPLAQHPDPFAVTVASCLSADVDKTADDVAAEIYGTGYTIGQRARVYNAIWRLRDYGLPIRTAGYLLDAPDAAAKAAVRRWIDANSRPSRRRNVSPKRPGIR